MPLTGGKGGGVFISSIISLPLFLFNYNLLKLKKVYDEDYSLEIMVYQNNKIIVISGSPVYRFLYLYEMHKFHDAGKRKLIPHYDNTKFQCWICVKAWRLLFLLQNIFYSRINFFFNFWSYENIYFLYKIYAYQVVSFSNSV